MNPLKILNGSLVALLVMCLTCCMGLDKDIHSIKEVNLRDYVLSAPTALQALLSLNNDKKGDDIHVDEKMMVMPFYATTLTVPGARWMRLFFANLELPDHIEINIKSLLDGSRQTLDKHRAIQWQLSTGYFNGDSVEIGLQVNLRQVKQTDDDIDWLAMLQQVKGLRDLQHFDWPVVTYQLERVMTNMETVPEMKLREHSLEELENGEKSICYDPDTRVFTNDTRQGRYIYDPQVDGCCTAWMIDDENHCFLSAGHCTESGSGLVEFNVPLSAADGTLIHPPIEDQYIVDQTSMQMQYQGTQDWRYFGVFPNSETGLTPVRAYGGDYYVLQKSGPAPPTNTLIRVTGYGENESFPPNHRRTLKTATGPFGSRSSGAVRYRVDTSNGNSGSAVFDEANQVAIGVHTLGGCRIGASTSTNSGTDIFLSTLQTALANPRGICAPKKH